MNSPKFHLNQIVRYTNGNLSTYTGIIKSIRLCGKSFSYTIIDDEAGMTLYNLGCAVGSDIQESQIIN